MNDVEMPDAGSMPPPKSKGISKTAKAGGTADEGKKRFEVKKWNAVALWAWDIVSNVKQTNSRLQAKNVRWPGEFAT
ncbi:MAG: hypothetical protein Q9212_003620 [Teloschistes hypoglaucus]